MAFKNVNSLMQMVSLRVDNEARTGSRLYYSAKMVNNREIKSIDFLVDEETRMARLVLREDCEGYYNAVKSRQLWIRQDVTVLMLGDTSQKKFPCVEVSPGVFEFSYEGDK